MHNDPTQAGYQGFFYTDQSVGLDILSRMATRPQFRLDRQALALYAGTMAVTSASNDI